MSRDRLVEADGPNIYAFVQNDSINWVDDTGLRRRRGRRRWGNLAGAHRFIWHFYTGGGDPVDIGDWGYLGHYRSASDVQVFECEARNEARASVDDCCAEDGTQWNGSYTRLVDGTDGLYVMGNGHPNADWTCTMNAGSVTCDLSYDITDSFEDPVDLESHVNRRLPGWLPRIPDWIVNLGGTPYPLTASWEDTVDGCSDPEDCSAVGGGRRRRR